MAATSTGMSRPSTGPPQKAGRRPLHLLKASDRIDKIAADAARHVAPNGFKAQVVVYDKEASVLFKAALDRYLPAEASAVVMSLETRDPQAWKDNFGLAPVLPIL
ncbi:hypothetical protein [Micromonospora sp. CA-244673]|uniref:hypothetical protein n=1 Tax=Micromonospora sp. CA-244673 TaxID=3239958 RepID=UPI003D90DC51